MTDKLSGDSEKEKNELMDKQLVELTEKSKYTINDFATMMRENLEKQKEGAGGWKSLVPGVKKNQDQAVEQGESMMKIFDVMTPDQLTGMAPITKRTRNRIAAGSGQSLAEVEQIFQNFNMLRNVHKWLQIRKKAGDPPPATMDEMGTLMEVDRRGLPQPQPLQRGPTNPKPHKYRKRHKDKRGR